MGGCWSSRPRRASDFEDIVPGSGPRTSPELAPSTGAAESNSPAQPGKPGVPEHNTAATDQAMPAKLGISLNVQAAQAQGPTEDEEVRLKQDKLKLWANAVAKVAPPCVSVAGALGISDATACAAANVRIILNAAADVVPARHTQDGVCVVSLSALDSPTEPISAYFASTVELLLAAAANHAGVAVHCHQGVSRSGTLAIAWLQWLHGIGWQAALDAARAGRATISPNAGFMAQLKQWQAWLQAPTWAPAHALWHVYKPRRPVTVHTWEPEQRHGHGHTAAAMQGAAGQASQFWWQRDVPGSVAMPGSGPGPSWACALPPALLAPNSEPGTVRSASMAEPRHAVTKLQRHSTASSDEADALDAALVQSADAAKAEALASAHRTHLALEYPWLVRRARGAPGSDAWLPTVATLLKDPAAIYVISLAIDQGRPDVRVWVGADWADDDADAVAAVAAAQAEIQRWRTLHPSTEAGSSARALAQAATVCEDSSQPVLTLHKPDPHLDSALEVPVAWASHGMDSGAVASMLAAMGAVQDTLVPAEQQAWLNGQQQQQQHVSASPTVEVSRSQPAADAVPAIMVSVEQRAAVLQMAEAVAAAATARRAPAPATARASPASSPPTAFERARDAAMQDAAGPSGAVAPRRASSSGSSCSQESERVDRPRLFMLRAEDGKQWQCQACGEYDDEDLLPDAVAVLVAMSGAEEPPRVWVWLGSELASSDLASLRGSSGAMSEAVLARVQAAWVADGAGQSASAWQADAVQWVSEGEEGEEFWEVFEAGF